MDKYIVLDLETTGFSADTNEIIQICGWKVENGVVVDKFSSYVRPHFYIPRTIQSLTGISYDDLKDCEPIEVVLVDFFEFCGNYSFIGHNIGFDFEFLRAKGKSLGLDFSLGGTRTGIDTLKLSRKYLHLQSNKLVDVLQALNIPLEGIRLHNAESDVYATKMVYDYFCIKYPGLSDVKIPELLTSMDRKYGRVLNNDELPLD